MRVIGGKAKGRKLLSVPGDSTRPILDRVRTALFDILRPDIEDLSVLDLFAGSGSVGIEALSQGARLCTFVDLSRKATRTIQKNLEATNLVSQAKVTQADTFSFLRTTSKTFDLVYIAPPQYQELWVKALSALDHKPDILSAHGQIIVQIDPSEYQSVELTQFEERRQKKYGNTLLVFYRKAAMLEL